MMAWFRIGRDRKGPAAGMPQHGTDFTKIKGFWQAVGVTRRFFSASMGAMVINYFGDGCFRLQSGELSLLVNPTSNRLKADVTLRTLFLAADPVSAEEIAHPGEYEAKGVEVQGWQVKEESTERFVKSVFAVTMENMRFVFLGHLSKPLSAAFLEDLGETDVVFVPTGDSHFIDPADAAKLMRQIEPKVIIPAYFKNANELVKAMGVKPEEMEKFTFKKKEIADAKGRLIVLEGKG